MDVQENLNAMVEEYNEMYDDTDCEPISLKDTDIQNLLIDSGIPQKISNDIEKSYVEIFGDDIPLAENLIDAKILKANEQRRKEEDLKKQVKMLETKLEEVQKEVAISNESEETIENDDTSEYDVVLQVKPEKVSQIKSQIIDGQKYLVIPINDDEHTKVNDLDDLI